MEKIIVEKIKETFSEEVELISIKKVLGGEISDSYKYKTTIGSFFVKTNSNVDSFKMFQSEAIGLKRISETDSIRVPKVYYLGKYSENKSFIIMEFIKFSSKSDEKKFARKLAKLHSFRPKEEKFGFEVDNFIGFTPQINQFESNWINFFKKNRLEKQFYFLNEDYVKIKKMGEELIKKLDLFFIGIKIKPSLIHGDLWSGNFSFDENGEPIIFDPATYYGHNEVELSIMIMFGDLSKQFFDEYHKILPKQKGFEERILIYQLYHYLNHLNLFGNDYQSICESILTNLLEKSTEFTK